MNNIFSKIKVLSFVALSLVLASCNDFLDENPDDRTTINNVEKVQKLLVSAYPNKTISFLTEYSSDNVMDNGKSFKAYDSQHKIYRFEDDPEQSNDDPKAVWESHYLAVATANAALDGIKEIGENAQTLPLKAEALLCRAYAIFSLTNCFCMAYDSLTANQYLGIPYPKESGVSVDSRGTLAETYANINADIEEALPLINDSYLKVPAYHFNRHAAYAFAARFNLYYQKWDMARKYASEALGSNPTLLMRTSLSTYGSFATADAFRNAYISASDPANFLLVPKYSIMGRAQADDKSLRYAHNQKICTYETYYAEMPWNKGNNANNNTLYESHMVFGDTYTDFVPFVHEFFETTDQVNRTGYTHIVEVAFTGDETALVRAEANILLNNLDEALKDMNNFVQVHCTPSYGTKMRPTLTKEELKEFWKGVTPYSFGPQDESNPKSPIVLKNMSPKKLLHTNIKLSEEQTALLYTILQMRRIETMWKGLRFQDIKRWGIEFIHPIDGEAAAVFKANDLRGAIQLPDAVIDAGLERNPR